MLQRDVGNERNIVPAISRRQAFYERTCAAQRLRISFECNSKRQDSRHRHPTDLPLPHSLCFVVQSELEFRFMRTRMPHPPAEQSTPMPAATHDHIRRRWDVTNRCPV